MQPSDSVCQTLQLLHSANSCTLSTTSTSLYEGCREGKRDNGRGEGDGEERRGGREMGRGGERWGGERKMREVLNYDIVSGMTLLYHSSMFIPSCSSVTCSGRHDPPTHDDHTHLTVRPRALRA